MSNHVSSQLIITGPAAQLDRFHERAKGVWPWRKWTDPDDKRHMLMVTQFIRPPLVAINDYNEVGYRWCSSQLGTKWGAYDVQYERMPEQITYLFSTANTALSADVFAAMAAAFPDLVFEYTYDEPGCQFEGGISAAGGVVCGDWEGEGDDYRGILCGPPEKEEEPEYDHP